MALTPSSFFPDHVPPIEVVAPTQFSVNQECYFWNRELSFHTVTFFQDEFLPIPKTKTSAEKKKERKVWLKNLVRDPIKKKVVRKKEKRSVQNPYQKKKRKKCRKVGFRR